MAKGIQSRHQVLKGSGKVNDKSTIKELEEIEQDNLESIKMLISLRKKVKQSNKKDKLQN